eukprot:3486466-Pyramimonas_sp.AAC.1
MKVGKCRLWFEIILICTFVPLAWRRQNNVNDLREASEGFPHYPDCDLLPCDMANRAFKLSRPCSHLQIPAAMLKSPLCGRTVSAAVA